MNSKLLEECNTAFVNQFGTCNEFYDTARTTIPDWNKLVEWQQPYDYTVPRDPFQPYSYEIRTYITEEKPKKEKNMKHLYHVIVVDLDEKILVDEKKVAENEDDAKFLAGVFSTLEQAKLKPTEVSIIVNTIGNVKVRSKTKEVIVKKSE